ncbi:MAG: choice-of-anchor D domain-containing protein [Acidobacteriia bacterium]|nr:choice-of-anchor D domain-containing protein [Terriglobia bacterium]
MTKGLPVLFVVLAASLAVATPALGQSVLQVSVTANGATSTVAPGGSVTLAASGIGQAVLATVTVRYTGAGSATITSLSFTGTSAMALVGAPTLPLNLFPNGTTSFQVQYLPSTGSSITGQVSIGFTESNQPSVFTFTVNGIAPDLAFTFFVLPNGALTALNPGDRIAFPATNLGSSASAVVNILNRGSAAGSLQSVTLSGADYQVTGSTAPATVPAGQQVSFTVVFTPHATVTSSGLLTVGLNNGNTIFFLSGLGTSPNLTVFYTLADNNVHPLPDGTMINVPSVDINGSTTVTIHIANQGTGGGTVTGISLAGAGFQLSGLPPLPLTVAAGQELRFGIVFAPSQPGTYTGTLLINLSGSSISATLTASTNPPNFAVSYALADGNVRTLSDGTAINFPAVDVNATTTASITILNQGTGAGTVTGISVAGTGFQLTGSPLLPATVGAGQNLRFGIVFSPTQPGSFTGTFNISLGGRSISGTLIASTNIPTLAVSYALADGIVHTLSDGADIGFPSVDINATTTATITIVNQGTGAGSITGISLAGAGFQLSGAPQLPATIAANLGVRFGIVFAPSKAGSYTGTFRIDLSGRSISGTLTASTASANFTLSYIDPDTGNILPLTNNSTLPFPNTVAGTTSSITLLAANTGAGTGSINSVTLGSSASAFQLLSLPPLPLPVPPSQQLKFGVRFSPQQQQNSTDTLRVDFNGQTTTINLQAQGIQSQFTYGLANGTGTTVLAPGGTIALADTAVGQTSSVVVSVFNFGTGDGQISTIGVTGQGLSLTNLPAVPFTLHPNGSQHFTLNFAPAQPGAISGQLTVGNDTFTITGTGIGSRLIYTYTSAASAVPVTDTGVVIFPPLAVGNTENLNFSVQNTGTSAATISSINLAAPSTIFALSQLPALPMNLDPGATVTFAVGFVPNNTGSLTATLRVNNSSFTLSGNGTQPAPLPGYQFQGPSGNQQPAQQPTLGLTLASPYPLALQGTLKLTFVSTVFTDDPAIQFASGGRTVNFTIPANSTQVLFSGNTTSMALQTGTTAGNIVITPAFAMQGGFDLTPSSPNVLTLTIQSSAPQLLNASVTSETLSSFTLVLNGYSTTRSMRQLDIQITPKQGQSFSVTHLTIDVSSASSAWFQGPTSQGFGGSFLVAIPFTLSNGSTTDDLVHRLQSLSITATNDVGASSAVSVSIP